MSSAAILLVSLTVKYCYFSASYDSTGSIPTTDISMETQSSRVTQESAFPKRNQPVPHSQQPRKPVEDPFISPASHQVCCLAVEFYHYKGALFRALKVINQLHVKMFPTNRTK